MNENKMNLQKHLAHFGMNISSTPSYTQADKESGECCVYVRTWQWRGWGEEWNGWKGP